jgi:hypothetical protein
MNMNDDSTVKAVQMLLVSAGLIIAREGDLWRATNLDTGTEHTSVVFPYVVQQALADMRDRARVDRDKLDTIKGMAIEGISSIADESPAGPPRRWRMFFTGMFQVLSLGFFALAMLIALGQIIGWMWGM